MGRAGKTIIVVGPTHDDQPAFDWQAYTNVSHVGLPDKYDFDWIVVDASLKVSPWHRSERWIWHTFVMLSVASITTVVLAATVVTTICVRASRKIKKYVSMPDDGYKNLLSSPAMSTWSTTCPSSPGGPQSLIFSPNSN